MRFVQKIMSWLESLLPSAENNDDRGPTQVAGWVIVFILFGCAIIFKHRQASATVALLWAGACLVLGALIGFLFGIPRTLQAERQVPPTAAPSTTSGKDRPANGQGYRQLVNTNLEQISDWLTKILVGLTLTQLNQLPQKFRLAAAYISPGLGEGDSTVFAYALILYFSITGFLGGYLLTRLFIARMFYQADQPPVISIHDVTQLTKVDSIEITQPTRIDAGPRASARAVEDLKYDELKTGDDYWAWAKAQFYKGDYAKAIDGYRRALQLIPDSIKCRTEYAITLFYYKRGTNAFNEVLSQLTDAYNRLSPSTDVRDRQLLYESITYVYLYVEPEGFQEAIRYGEEYVQNPHNPESDTVFVNLAAAYGQQYKALLDQQATTEQLSTVRAKGLESMKRALAIDPSLKSFFISLLVHDLPGKDPAENDLEVFEHDAEFRAALGLSVEHG